MSRGETWSAWARNGRLATIALVVVGAAWFYYQKTTPIAERNGTLDQILMAMVGLWVGNVAFAQGKKDQAVEHKVDQLQEQMGVSTVRADESEARADKSEVRETGPSLHVEHPREVPNDESRGRHASRD
jgi:hypothetical protein